MKLATLDRTLGPLFALVTAFSAGSDWSVSLWSAGLPWIPGVYQDVWIGAGDLGLVILVLYCGVVGTIPTARGFTSRVTIAAGVVLVGFMAISAFRAPAPLLSVAMTVKIALGLAAFVAITHRPRYARWLLIGFGGLILLELPLSVLQEMTQSHVQIGSLFGPVIAADPASAPGAAVVFGPAGARWQRAMGSFPHPNVLGGFVAVALVLTLPYFEKVGRNRLVGLLVLWSFAWAELIFSFSRAALVASLVGCGVWLLGRRARPAKRLAPTWLVIVPIAALALGGVVAGPFLVPRLAPNATMLSSTPISGRLMLGQVALSLIRAHPLVGVGAGNFTVAELAPPFDAIAVDPVHAVPLLVAAEAGLPAALAWLTIVIGGPVVDWRRRRKFDSGSTAWFALPAAMLALALLDHYLWTLPSGRLLFWLGLGIWAATGAEAHSAGSDLSMATVSATGIPDAVAIASGPDGVGR